MNDHARFCAAVAALCLLFLCPDLLARPRGRIVGPRGGETFNREIAAWPTGGWSGNVVACKTGPNGESLPDRTCVDPSSLRYVVTLSAIDAPWSDPEWRASNPRFIAGAFEVPVYRYRNGAFCRIDTLSLPAERFAAITFELPERSLREGDALLFELWAGYETKVETFSGVRPWFVAAMRRVEPGQPKWTQRHSVMRCDP